jgi:hypothetical protein
MLGGTNQNSIASKDNKQNFDKDVKPQEDEFDDPPF